MTSTRAASKKPLIVIFITVFVDLIGFGIIIPQSPYLAREFGASATQVGYLMAIYSAFQFLFSPFWGRLSDRFGRKPILLISLFGGAVSHFVFFMAPNLYVLFIARGLAGLFGANISTAMAAIADVTEEKDRSKGMGLIGAAFGLGFILGPAISGIVSIWSAAYPPLAAAFICGANFLLAIKFFPETLKSKNRIIRPRKNRLEIIKKHIKKPIFRYLLTGYFLTGLSMANMEAPMFLFLKDRFTWNITTSSFGFAYIGIWIAITQGFIIRKILPIWGEKRMLLVGLALFSLGLFGIGASYNLVFLTLSVTAMAVGSGFTNPAMMGSVSLLSEANEQGEVMGVMQSLAALARIIGPPIGGFIYGNLGISIPFYLASSFGLIALLMLWTQRRNIPSRAQSH
jgi:DHA1 family tetracycline resistance protein-like MFS transporter